MVPPWELRWAGCAPTDPRLKEEAVRSVILAAGGSLCLASLIGAAAVLANPVKSLYTTVELKACKPIKHEPHGGAWLCEGLGGLPVYVAEGDLRQFLSVGTNAQSRRAATQTLGAVKIGRASCRERVGGLG